MPRASGPPEGTRANHGSYAEQDRVFFRGVDGLAKTALRPRTQTGLRGLAGWLAAAAGFGALFHGKLTEEMVETAFSVFAETPTVCVFQTPEQYAAEVERWFAGAKGDARTGVVRLEPLDAQEVGDMARERWKQAAPGRGRRSACKTSWRPSRTSGGRSAGRCGCSTT